jgi:hypothetical protein
LFMADVSGWGVSETKKKFDAQQRERKGTNPESNTSRSQCTAS